MSGLDYRPAMGPGGKSEGDDKLAYQIFLGLIMTAVVVGFGAITIVSGAEFLRRSRHWLFVGNHVLRHVFVLTLVASWLVLSMFLVMLFWAGLLVQLGVFDSLEPALYFSMISFTTLGFGDVILPVEWRLLSGFIAADGFLLFGLNTAFLFEVLRQFRISPDRH